MKKILDKFSYIKIKISVLEKIPLKRQKTNDKPRKNIFSIYDRKEKRLISFIFKEVMIPSQDAGVGKHCACLFL